MFLGQLKRYASPLDVGQWLRTTQLKLSAGELKAVSKPPENATPEQMTAWRKEQGLPEAAGDYIKNLKLADGVVPGEADKPLLEAVAAMAHKGNYSQEAVNDFVGLYYSLQDGLVAQRQEADDNFRMEAQQTLVQQMGADFKPNMQAMKTFWSEQPAGIADMILGARTPDGRVVGNIPEIASWVASLSRELNPAAAILPAGVPANAQSIAARITEIEGLMYKDSPTPGVYGPGYTAAVQQEYRELIDAQQKMQARAA